MTRYVARQVINMLLPLFKWSNVTSSGFLSVLDPAFDKRRTSNLIWTKLYWSFICKIWKSWIQVQAKLLQFTFIFKLRIVIYLVNDEWRVWQTYARERLVKCDLIYKVRGCDQKALQCLFSFFDGPCKEIASADTDDPLAIFFSPTRQHKCFAPLLFPSEAKRFTSRPRQLK